MAEHGERHTVAVDARNEEKIPKLDDSGDDLIPGIPNNITLDHIFTKLSWKAFYKLSLVSPTWLQAIRSGRVYQARVGSQSAETLLVHSHRLEMDSSGEEVFLYSGRERFCYEMGAILDDRGNRGIPWQSQCVALDGKVYVLGGGEEYYDFDRDYEAKGVFKEVYVMDFVGQGGRKWEQCASMQEGRRNFGCGVIGGKIYVFGGAGQYGPVRGSEVYDPHLNVWFPINPMQSLRFCHRVCNLGEVLLVYGGQTFDADHAAMLEKAKANRNPFRHEGRRRHNFIQEAAVLEAYHPAMNEWRVVEPFRTTTSECLFVANGKIHVMSKQGIYVQDPDTVSWKVLHSNSFDARKDGRSEIPFDSSKNYAVTPDCTVVANDELFVGVYWESTRLRGMCGCCFLECKGFGSDRREIVWHEANCDEDNGEFGELKCAIQL